MPNADISLCTEERAAELGLPVQQLREGVRAAKALARELRNRNERVDWAGAIAVAFKAMMDNEYRFTSENSSRLESALALAVKDRDDAQKALAVAEERLKRKDAPLLEAVRHR